jgi:hypothetical protein
MANYFEWNTSRDNMYFQELGIDGRILLQFTVENQVKDSIEVAYNKAKWRNLAHIV